MSSFKLGQEVVCINNTGVEEYLLLNKTYIIEGFHTCGCGLSLFIGYKEPIQALFIACADCGKLKADDGNHPFKATRFKPLDEMFNEEIAEIQEFINQPCEV